VLKNLLLSSLLFLSATINATYVYEADQALIDLTGVTGTTNLGASDDGVSNAFNLGFTFDYYGQEFTQARMATNGCLHFKTSGAYCNDYTPDPLTGQHTYTLYPFWTDLIRDGGSSVLAKSYTDKTVFGWYDMKEYGRNNSDNSFEVILWTNDTFEFRYGALDITKHDVAIGEVGSGATEIYQYLFHDQCSTGTTNVSGTCTSSTWNDSSSNTLLESGGSLYGVGSGNALDCSSALNDVNCTGYAAAYLTQQCDLDLLYSDACTGYAAAYLTQQCDITQLYDTTCPNYWDAYDSQQCEEDSQYSPSCPSYLQEESVAYYVEETDYGYTEEDLWYDEEYDEYLDPSDPCYQNACENMTDADWYELDIEQFGQEQVDEWYGEEVAFTEEGNIEYGAVSEEEYWTVIDDGMDVYDTEQEEIQVAEDLAWEEEHQRYEEEMLQEELFLLEEETYAVELHTIEEEQLEYLEEFVVVDEYVLEHTDVIDVLDAEELIELYEFDTIIREELDYEEEIFAIREEMEDEHEEEMEELQEEDEEFIELEEEIEERLAEVEEEEEEGKQKNKRSSVRVSALSVVASTLRTAEASVVESEVSTSESVAVSVANYISEELFSENFNTESTSSSAVINFNNPTSTSAVVLFGGANYGSTTSASTTSVSSSSVVSSSASSGGGISTSSSPSRSDQFASSSAQTQQVLSMSSVAVTETAGGSDNSSIGGSSGSSVSISITPMQTFDSSPQVVMAEVQVTNMDNQIDTAVSGVMTASEADQVADRIVANNIKEQQQEAQQEQEETGEYADSTTLVAYLGYVQGFDNYRDAQIPKQNTWYEPRAIYAGARINDNTRAFNGLANTSLNTLGTMIGMQPNL